MLSRRNLLKIFGIGAAAATTGKIAERVEAVEEVLPKQKKISQLKVPVAPVNHAIKADRTVLAGNDSYFMKQETAARGEILSLEAESSTGYPCTVKTQENDEAPIGLLLNDVVCIDYIRQNHWTYDQVPSGGKVSVMSRGTIITTVSGDPSPGDACLSWGGVMNPYKGVQVGRFLSGKDEDGFAQIELDI